MRTVGGSETWHRDTNDTLAIKVELIECFHGNEQSQRRVETATDTDDSFLGVDMIETFGKTCHLDIQDLLTGRLHILVLRDKRMRIDDALQFEVVFLNGFAGNLQCMGMALGIDKRGVLTTLYTQLLNIYLALLDLGREAETITFYKEMSILEDHGVATIDEILCGFTEAAAGIDIATNRAGTLLSQQ